MMARGEVALIVTAAVINTETLGEYALSPDFMIMTVLLILISSILTPILLKVLYSKEKPSALPPTELPPDEPPATETADAPQN